LRANGCRSGRRRSGGRQRAGTAENSDVGLELAQAFRRFGSRVSVIETGPQVVSREDPDVAVAVLDMLSDEGIDGLIQTHLDNYEASGAELIMGTGRFLAPKTLEVALGQEPPISLRSTTAVRWPERAMCQARYLPPSPLPRMSMA